MPKTTSPKTTRTSRTTKTKPSSDSLYAFDAEKRAAHGVICGVDEAGRGPLCGPVCCAAVILNPDNPIEGVNDSKKLTEKRREALFDEITRRALAYKIVFITPQEIDERNILWATMDGMAQAVAGLDLRPDHVLIMAIAARPALPRRQNPSSRAMPTVRPSRQHPSWPRSAVTATCWNWTSSTPSTSWPNTKAIPPSCIMS